MRCTDCETEPLNLARYCECCGREMSLHETQAEEPSLFGEEAEDDGRRAELMPAERTIGLPTRTQRLTCVIKAASDPVVTAIARSQVRSRPRSHTQIQSTPQSNEVTASAETQPVEETAFVRVDGINRVIAGCIRSRNRREFGNATRRSPKRRRHR